MNKVGTLLSRLHAAELDLGDEWRKVAERHATEQDVWHTGHQLAEQCAARAEQVRALGERYDASISEPHDVALWDTLLAAVRRTTAELIGRRPEPGLLLLIDLRRLYAAAHEVDLSWIMLGQVAQALRDRELLSQVDELHRQLLTQIKWIKTKVKEATPQVIAAGRATAEPART
ncbi:MAG: hypothetical protein ACJ735_06305 [Actinomycetes bacterium]